jgi:hypothetical protein
MILGEDRLASNRQPPREIKGVYVRDKAKRYASPGGGSKIYTELTNHWANIPAIGVRNGQSLAKNDDRGSIPSRPSSWTILPWENTEARLFPKADNAIKRLSTYGQLSSTARESTLMTYTPSPRQDRIYFGRRAH